MDELTRAYERLRSIVDGASNERSVVTTGAPVNASNEIRRLLPADVVQFYAASGPAFGSGLPWVVDELLLFSVDELPSAQVGYRWRGPTGEPLPGWPSEWVVVASILGDPILIDVSRAGAPVYFARHGTGAWVARRIAPKLSTFFEVLAEFEFVVLRTFDAEVWDEGVLKSDFISHVRLRISDLLASDELDYFIEVVAG